MMALYLFLSSTVLIFYFVYTDWKEKRDLIKDAKIFVKANENIVLQPDLNKNEIKNFPVKTKIYIVHNRATTLTGINTSDLEFQDLVYSSFQGFREYLKRHDKIEIY